MAGAWALRSVFLNNEHRRQRTAALRYDGQKVLAFFQTIAVGTQGKQMKELPSVPAAIEAHKTRLTDLAQLYLVTEVAGHSRRQAP
jgi:hypothetical protein